LDELACQIKGTAEFEEIKVADFGRIVDIDSPNMGKSIRLELGQWMEQMVINVTIRKLQKGFDARDNVAKYLESAKCKALARVNNEIFYYKNAEIGRGEVTIKLATKLSEYVALNRIVAIASNILDIRAKLDLR